MSNEVDPKNKRHSIASLSHAEIESYFNARYVSTKKLQRVKKILNKVTPAQLSKLATAMGDDYKTDLYWSQLEYHFDKLFIYGDCG